MLKELLRTIVRRTRFPVGHYLRQAARAMLGDPIRFPPDLVTFSMANPTNVHAALGNGRLTAGISRQGEITVLRWPTPSQYNHVEYLATHYDRPRMGARPEMGSFGGIELRGSISWLRDWPTTQRYATDTACILETRHERDGMRVTCTDWVLPDRDTLVRYFRFEGLPGEARFVYHEDFAPCTRRIRHIPIADWLLAPLNDGSVRFDGKRILHSRDWVTITVEGDRPPIAFDCRPAGLPERLAGRDFFQGRGSSALAWDAGKELTVFISAGRGPLDRPAGTVPELLERSRRWWEEWIARARLPEADEACIRVCRRGLMATRVAAAESGAIVASICAQPPYAFDWPRDSAFINRALDVAGYSEMVTRHNLWYTRRQRTRGPFAGTYCMNYYADGEHGGFVPFEIDNTALLTWSLWDHATFAGSEYLAAVYPAIRRAADFLSWWRRADGLPFWASEDDNPLPTCGLQGAASVCAALDAALQAGRAMNESPSRLERWRRRRRELTRAIVEHFWNGQEFRGILRAMSWVLWPGRVLPANDPRMAVHAEALWQRIRPFFEERPDGIYFYFAEHVLSLAQFDQGCGRFRDRLRAALRVLTHEGTTETGHYGEIYRVRSGRIENLNDIPHIWEHALVYLAAMTLYPP